MSCENKYPCPLPPCKPDAPGKFKISVAKKGCDSKSRFSDRQVKLLETIFETETKIEPLKKVQLARELGLEPRQVAIWFQNRRARWKSKQIEKEYQVLKASYETLTAQVESLKQEKQSLSAQLQSLSLALQKARESKNGEQVKPVRLAEMEGNGTFKAMKNYQSSEEPGDSPRASTQDWCGIIARHGLVPPCRETKWWEF